MLKNTSYYTKECRTSHFWNSQKPYLYIIRLSVHQTSRCETKSTANVFHNQTFCASERTENAGTFTGMPSVFRRSSQTSYETEILLCEPKLCRGHGELRKTSHTSHLAVFSASRSGPRRANTNKAYKARCSYFITNGLSNWCHNSRWGLASVVFFFLSD